MFEAMLLMLAIQAGEQPAAQPRWVAFFRHDIGGVSAWDANSVERDGEVVRVRIWWRMDGVPNPPFAEARLHNEINCANRTARLLSFAGFHADGSIAASQSSPMEAETVRDGTPGGALWDALCGAGRDFPEPPPTPTGN
jgi:hypothetical protein